MEGTEDGRKIRAPNWITDEIEPIISWLEFAGNYERTKNQVRDTWMFDLASVVLTRTTSQICSFFGGFALLVNQLS